MVRVFPADRKNGRNIAGCLKYYQEYLYAFNDPGLGYELGLGRRIAEMPGSATGGAGYWALSGALTLELDDGWRAALKLEAQDRTAESARAAIDLGAAVERDVAPDLSVGLVAWRSLAGESRSFSIGLRMIYRVTAWTDRGPR